MHREAHIKVLADTLPRGLDIKQFDHLDSVTPITAMITLHISLSTLIGDARKAYAQDT